MTKKILASAALALALGCGAAYAVDIGNLSGQSCGSDSGTWHFVNNQTGTTTVGVLTATWSSGDTCTVSASKVTPNGTQHFYCTATGTLLSASTNLGGKLVLSDYSCETVKCDPKVEVCGK